MPVRKKLKDESPPIPLEHQPKPKRGPKDTPIPPKFTGNPKSTSLKKKVNENQLNFVDEVLKHGNASKAYRIAYPESSDDASRVGGSRLLSQPHIRAAIDELMHEAGFNDDYMDAKLLNIIDTDVDNRTKLQAIKHYNEITGRSNHTLDVHVSPKFDLTKLTDEELDTFLKLADKSKG
jgi:hypothetical protein